MPGRIPVGRVDVLPRRKQIEKIPKLAVVAIVVAVAGADGDDVAPRRLRSRPILIRRRHHHHRALIPRITGRVVKANPLRQTGRNVDHLGPVIGGPADADGRVQVAHAGGIVAGDDRHDGNIRDAGHADAVVARGRDHPRHRRAVIGDRRGVVVVVGKIPSRHDVAGQVRMIRIDGGIDHRHHHRPRAPIDRPGGLGIDLLVMPGDGIEVIVGGIGGRRQGQQCKRQGSGQNVAWTPRPCTAKATGEAPVPPPSLPRFEQ